MTLSDSLLNFNINSRIRHYKKKIIIPASRINLATYNGKTDRLMIAVNFYSLN